MVMYNATGIDLTQKSFELLPDGKYTLKITKAKQKESKNKHLMASLECEVINNAEYNGRKVFHNVTFLPPENKAAGMSIHFLKTIGQPWEGQIDIDIPAWEGAQFMAKLGKSSYVSPKSGATVWKNEIKSVEPVEEGIPF